MTHQISLRTIGTRCMVFATAVAAFCILSVSSANAQSTTWTVTVVATGSDAKPAYHVSPTSGGCPNQTTQNPKKLHVCPGDTVQWGRRPPRPKTKCICFRKNLYYSTKRRPYPGVLRPRYNTSRRKDHIGRKSSGMA